MRLLKGYFLCYAYKIPKIEVKKLRQSCRFVCKEQLAAILLFFLIFSFFGSPSAAAKKAPPKIILYVPHDGRPICAEQTAQAIESAGFVVKMPPNDLLGSRENSGQPQKIYDWLMENGTGAHGAVVSADTLLYGSLVQSRKHKINLAELIERVKRLENVHKKFPQLKLFVFSSIMRTPRDSSASGTEEPSYYRLYGKQIFLYTQLLDKQRACGLTEEERQQLVACAAQIPPDVLKDWLGRRQKNLAANCALINLSKEGAIDYLALGCDDNAPYSQTHRESVILKKYMSDVSKDRICMLQGIDEVGLLLLTRQVDEMLNFHPVIDVAYASGYGGGTIPKYSDEPIDDSINDEIRLAGGIPSATDYGASLILLVNTNVSGYTYEANTPLDVAAPRANTASFLAMIKNYVLAKRPVAVADIAFANGADNALMAGLARENLLFKLYSYAGWNTATNSTGWAIAQGILSLHMSPEKRRQLLLARYLDDWVYQANVRQQVARLLNIFPGTGSKLFLGDKILPARLDAQRLMQSFIDQNMPQAGIKSVSVHFPWNRLFEAQIAVSQQKDAFAQNKLFDIVW